MRTPYRLLTWLLTSFLQSPRSLVVPLLCGLLFLFGADCRLSESDLRYSHPDIPIVYVCDKPLDVPDDVDFWGFDFITRKLVTAEDPAELRTFDAADKFFKYDPDAPESSAQEMPSEYGLTCRKRAKAFADASLLFFAPEAELWKTGAPCPAMVAEVGRADPRLLAAPVGAACKPTSQAKKKVPHRLHACARPEGVPQSAAEWAKAPPGSESKWTTSGKDFAEASANSDLIFVFDEKAIPETIYYFVTDPSKLQCPNQRPPLPYDQVKKTDMLAILNLASIQAAAIKPGSGQGNGQSTLPPATASSAPKNGDGQTTTTSSPDGKGKPLSFTEILTRNLSIIAALANADTSGSLKDPNGERYGMVGGTNVGGPNLEILQLTAGVFSLVGNPIKSGNDLIELVTKARANKKVVGILDPNVLSKELAEKMAKEPTPEEMKAILEAIEKGKELPYESFGKAMAKSLNEAQVIMPYSRAEIFTKGWEAKFQAHHIFEVNMFDRLGKGELAKDGPAVILSKAEHDAITGELAKARKTMLENVAKANRDVQPADVWAMYQKAYAGRPEWLEAIESYIK